MGQKAGAGWVVLMSDEPDIESPEAVDERINLRINHNKCPFCGTDDWYIMSQNIRSKNIVGMVLAINWVGVAAYTLFCQKCGYVRQHVKSIVDGLVSPTEEKK